MPPKYENKWHPAKVVDQSVKMMPYLVLLQEYEEAGAHHHPDHLATAEHWTSWVSLLIGS
jgi:hypothetical protein